MRSIKKSFNKGQSSLAELDFNEGNVGATNEEKEKRMLSDGIQECPRRAPVARYMSCPQAPTQWVHRLSVGSPSGA